MSNNILAITNVKTQTNNTPTYDKEVQTEVLIVHDKETQNIKTICHNKEIQVDIQPKIVMMDNDLRIVTLQKYLAQAQQTIEKITVETVPQEKYQKLQ